LNYLAVLKIVKKHDKNVTTTKFHKTQQTVAALFNTKFCAVLQNLQPFIDEERQCCKLADLTKCPVCLENVACTAKLRCGHSFCWCCVAKCAEKDLRHCPICRQHQSLRPSDITVESILGCISDHYFPLHIETTKLDRGVRYNAALATEMHSCSAPAQETEHFVLMTLNVFAGSPVPFTLEPLDGSERLETQCRRITKLQPDILCLQEVMSCAVADRYSQTLGDNYGTFWVSAWTWPGVTSAVCLLLALVVLLFFVLAAVALAAGIPVHPLAIFVFAAVVIFGDYCNIQRATIFGFLGRGPAGKQVLFYKRSKLKKLSEQQFFFKEQGGDFMNLWNPRGFLHATFEIPHSDRKLHVHCTHTNALPCTTTTDAQPVSDPSRLAQMEELIGYIKVCLFERLEHAGTFA